MRDYCANDCLCKDCEHETCINCSECQCYMGNFIMDNCEFYYDEDSINHLKFKKWIKR